jgi:thiol-disulfide isomerase/thioredoxin
VYKASFDRRKAEVTVVAGPAVDVLGAAKALSTKEDYALEAGAGKGSYIAWTPPPAGVDVQTVAKDGADVPDLGAVVAKGKVTVVDFSAIWCEPCRKLDEHVLGILQKRPDVAYRKLDIGDWDTPLAQRYLKGIPSLPYVIVFDKRGQRVEAIAGLDLAKVDLAIERGAK